MTIPAPGEMTAEVLKLIMDILLAQLGFWGLVGLWHLIKASNPFGSLDEHIEHALKNQNKKK